MIFTAKLFIGVCNATSHKYSKLEVKPCGLGSRIRDMEAESYNSNTSIQ
jgi:hypothetical protein